MPEPHATFLLASPPALRPWVEQVWYSCGPLDLPRERVLPTVTTDLVANLGPPMWLLEGQGDRQIVGTTVSGLLRAPLLLGHPPVHEAVGVRLSVLGLRAVLDLPPAAAYDLVLPLHTLLPSRTDELAETCARAPTPQAKLHAALAWLARRIALHASTVDPIAAWAAGQVLHHHGRLSIEQLQRASGYGPTRFRARFVDELGLSPKQLARLARFDRALRLLSPDRPLSELAHACGYADQAHLNLDFRAFAGLTPTAILAGRYTSGVTVAEGEHSSKAEPTDHATCAV